jgi:hypothetical protein
MSLRILVPSALLILGAAQAGIAENPSQEKFAPVVYGIQRYEPIWKRSPFIKETVNVVRSDSLANKYKVQAFASLGNDPMILLQDTTKDAIKGRFLVIKGKSNSEGVELVNVSPDPDVRKAKFEIRQGDQQAILDFDPAVVGQASVPVMPGAVPPGMVPPGAGVIPPQPGIPVPQVGAIPQSVIPNPGAPPVTNNQQVGSNVPPLGGGALPSPPPVPRRIIRPAPINMNN